VKNVIKLSDLVLKHGNHKSPEAGMCINEAAAYFAGEPHSDAPQCVDPAITRFTIRLNDRLNEEKRQRMKPLIELMIGTRGTEAHTALRRAMISEWYIQNVALPRIDMSATWSWRLVSVRCLR
jgi:hypothetical protein